MTVWALDKYERTSIRHLIVCFSQGIIAFQLTVTFLFQMPIINYELIDSRFAMACDLFGVILKNI